MSLLWKIPLPFCQQRPRICFPHFSRDTRWKASTEIIWNKIVMFQCKMQKTKYAIVFWTLSKTPFSAVLSLYVSSNGKCLLAKMFTGYRIFNFQIAKQGTVKQSSIILFSRLNNLYGFPLHCPRNLLNAYEVAAPSNFSVHDVYYTAKVNPFPFLVLFVCLFEVYYAVPQQCRQKWGHGLTFTEEQTAL